MGLEGLFSSPFSSLLFSFLNQTVKNAIFHPIFLFLFSILSIFTSTKHPLKHYWNSDLSQRSPSPFEIHLSILFPWHAVLLNIPKKKSIQAPVYIRFHAIHKMLDSILQTTQIQGIVRPINNAVNLTLCLRPIWKTLSTTWKPSPRKQVYLPFKIQNSKSFKAGKNGQNQLYPNSPQNSIFKIWNPANRETDVSNGNSLQNLFIYVPLVTLQGSIQIL